ncbi:CATSPER1 [Symbiodinium necroappetens]|uniref:CATSPER1 protein n=1 Tax=Symbiodinium necroappetens TaxID=1628268 RepID=A0A812JCH1_9DINO|nr:CATSPER1 [Symbiodinium necroappetens]
MQDGRCNHFQDAIAGAEKDHELNLQMLAHERAKYFRAVKRLFQQPRAQRNYNTSSACSSIAVALQDPTLLQVFNALEISADVLLQNLGFVYAVGFGILAAAVKRKKSSQRLMLDTPVHFAEDGDAHVDADEFLEGALLEMLHASEGTGEVMGIKRDLAVVKQRLEQQEALGTADVQLRDDMLFKRLEDWLSRMEAVIDNALSTSRQVRPVTPRSFCSSGGELSLDDAPITKVRRKTRVATRDSWDKDLEDKRPQHQGEESPSAANILPDLPEDRPKFVSTRTKALESQEPASLREQVAGCMQTMLATNLDKEDEKLSFPRRALARIVKSWLFEAFFALVILSNSVFIAVQVEATARDPGINQDVGYFVVGSIYTFLFTTELVLRVLVFGLTVFVGPDWAWLLLDLLVVSSSLFEFVLELALQQQEDSTSVLTNMRLLRILRIGRITRAIRVVRLVKFIRSLRQLLYSIGQTLRAMAWSVVLLGLIIFLFGLIFTDISSEYLTRDVTEISEEFEGFIVNRFGGLERSMHTLFASVTGGLTWIEALDALSHISTVWGLLFEAYIAFCLFAVLNVMTGVFCQSAMESAEKDHELVLQNVVQEKAKYFRAVRRLFAQLDQNGDGGITAKEFEVALEDPALMHVFDALEISADDAWNLFTQLDSDGDAHVDAEEFLEGCMLLKGPARSIDVMGIKRDVAVVKHRLQQVFATLRYSGAVRDLKLSVISEGKKVPVGYAGRKARFFLLIALQTEAAYRERLEGKGSPDWLWEVPPTRFICVTALGGERNDSLLSKLQLDFCGGQSSARSDAVVIYVLHLAMREMVLRQGQTAAIHFTSCVADRSHPLPVGGDESKVPIERSSVVFDSNTYATWLKHGVTVVLATSYMDWPDAEHVAASFAGRTGSFLAFLDLVSGAWITLCELEPDESVRQFRVQIPHCDVPEERAAATPRRAVPDRGIYHAVTMEDRTALMEFTAVLTMVGPSTRSTAWRRRDGSTAVYLGGPAAVDSAGPTTSVPALQPNSSLRWVGPLMRREVIAELIADESTAWPAARPVRATYSTPDKPAPTQVATAKVGEHTEKLLKEFIGSTIRPRHQHWGDDLGVP